MGCPGAPGEIGSAHAGHDDIGQQDVDDAALVEQPERGLAAGRLHHGIAQTGQDLGGGEPDGIVVIDDEYDGVAGSLLKRVVESGSGRLGPRRRAGQIDADRGPLARGAVDAHVAA